MTKNDGAAREQRAYERLRTDKPRCPGCGETDWRCFDAHHLAGKRRDTFTIPVCANCHRKLTDDQLDHPELNDSNDRLLETVGHLLLGLADLCRLLVAKLTEFGTALIERSAAAYAERA
jgi:hypothetical protein